VSKRVAPDRALQIFFVGVLANYLPWVLVTRCTFIYHFFATVPFILMATVYALQKLEQKYRDANFIKWVWIGFALLFFILLYPGLSGLPVPAGWASFLSKLPGGKLMYGA
jgi:dolichyl-phosphate-mannose--protein O-mannosyl transferase